MNKNEAILVDHKKHDETRRNSYTDAKKYQFRDWFKTISKSSFGAYTLVINYTTII